MKRVALIFSIFAILFVAGGLVVSETVKQNQDEIIIIQNANLKVQNDNAKIKNEATDNEINDQSSIRVDPLEIRVNPSPDDKVLGENVGKLSVNEATIEELDTIPGVGPVTAQKIIDGRHWENLEEALKLISTRYRDAAREKLKL